MKVQAKAGTQFCAFDGPAGEGLSIFLSQGKTDTVRWRIEVLAHLDSGEDFFVGFFYTAPPAATPTPGQVTRQVAAAVCPGAKTWSVYVSPASGSAAAPNEVANVTLGSSKCCTAPVGVTRVGERYGYVADNANPSAYLVLPGQVITRIRAHGVGAGTIQIGAGNTITVATGSDMVLDPQAPIPPGTTITFTLCTYVIEFKESA